MDKPKVFIDGREGTTGLQLWERLSRRTDLELLRIGEARRKDPAERKKYLNAADLVFLCLPDAAAWEMDPVHIFPINGDKENAVISRHFSTFTVNLVQVKSSKNKGF